MSQQYASSQNEPGRAAVPESKKRKKTVYTPPVSAATTRKKKPSPVWLAPLMLALFVIGVIWLVVFYVSNGQYPISALSNGNLLVGFAFIVVGFVLSTQWR